MTENVALQYVLFPYTQLLKSDPHLCLDTYMYYILCTLQHKNNLLPHQEWKYTLQISLQPFQLFETNVSEVTSRPLVTRFCVKKIKAAEVCRGTMGICSEDAVSPGAFHLELTFLTMHIHQCQKLYRALQQTFYICLKGCQSAYAVHS